MFQDASVLPEQSMESDFKAILKKGFAPDSLQLASWDISKGRHIGPESVAAIQAANPDWRSDVRFFRYVEETNGGRKKPRGRPPLERFRPREQAADVFYEPARRFIRRERAAGRLEARVRDAVLVDKIGRLDPGLALHLLSAEVVQRWFGLPISAGRYYQRKRHRENGTR